MVSRPREIVASSRPSPLRKWVRTHVLERTLRRVPRTADVLDFCCGYGFYFDINPAASGFDGDPACVATLRARGLDVTLGNALQRLPYDDGRFGWVLAHDVLEHFSMDELRGVLSEVHRILRPDGKFVVFVPNRRGFDLGVRRGVGHRLFVTHRELSEVSAGLFAMEAFYPEPLPRWIGEFFSHNKEVFWLRRI